MSSDRAASGSQTSLREANRARIVDAVKRHAGVTQVELAALTGLSAATVSNIVKELTHAGIVNTRPTSRSGRRAQQVTLARRLGLVAGVHFGHRRLHVAVADFGAQTVAEQDMPLPTDHRADTGLDRATLLISDLLESIGTDLSELTGVGIAVPAPVDPRTGLIAIGGILPGWDGVPVAQVAAKRLGRPVFVANNANCAALAEYRYGAGRGIRETAYVLASHTVGAGLMLAGQVVEGHSGTAGEIGHIRVDPNGPICRCGNRGCLETVVSSNALLGLLRTSHGNLTLGDMIARALEGDPGCRRVIGDAGRSIGAVLGSLCATVNPQRLIIGGELAGAGDIFIEPLRDALMRAVVVVPNEPLEIVPSELGERAEVMGAVCLALDSTDVSTDLTTTAAEAR